MSPADEDLIGTCIKQYCDHAKEAIAIVSVASRYGCFSEEQHKVCNERDERNLCLGEPIITDKIFMKAKWNKHVVWVGGSLYETPTTFSMYLHDG